MRSQTSTMTVRWLGTLFHKITFELLQRGMQSVVRAASLGQLARASVTAVPSAGASVTPATPPAAGLPLVQAPGAV